MPEKKYMSHSDANCEDAEEMARRAMGGGTADQNKQVRKYRKKSKALLKKINKMTSKNKKLYKMTKKRSSDSKQIRKLKRKIAECNSSSDDDSDDSDDASLSSASDSDTDWDQGGQAPPKRINLIDKIISKPFLNDKDLINDVHNNELKFQSSKGKEKKILLQ